MNTQILTVSSKGQISLPVSIRKLLRSEEHTSELQSQR